MSAPLCNQTGAHHLSTAPHATLGGRQHQRTDDRSPDYPISSAIFHSLPRQGSARQDQARTFANLITTGKTSAAIRTLSEDQKGGVHSVGTTINGQTVLDILKSKHRPAAPANATAMITGDVPPSPHPVLYSSITREAIREAALHTQGAAGPSGLDAASWRRMCTAFHGASDDLCDSLASCARRIASSYVDPTALEAFLASRLIPLDKQPGVRPIGIGEVARRIIGKAILRCASSSIQKSAGCLQLCAGQECGIEAAIHAMQTAFQEDEAEGVLFADASNAFNSLNRAVSLHNIQRTCPTIAPALPQPDSAVCGW